MRLQLLLNRQVDTFLWVLDNLGLQRLLRSSHLQWLGQGLARPAPGEGAQQHNEGVLALLQDVVQFLLALYLQDLARLSLCWRLLHSTYSASATHVRMQMADIMAFQTPVQYLPALCPCDFERLRLG